MVKSVPDRLAALGDIYRERNKLYSDNYKNFGWILEGMFPHGIHLVDSEAFNRFALFLQMVHKLSRYARSINSGGHADSLDDLAVYAQMLREYDEGVKDDGEENHDKEWFEECKRQFEKNYVGFHESDY